MMIVIMIMTMIMIVIANYAHDHDDGQWKKATDMFASILGGYIPVQYAAADRHLTGW